MDFLATFGTPLKRGLGRLLFGDDEAPAQNSNFDLMHLLASALARGPNPIAAHHSLITATGLSTAAAAIHSSDTEAVHTFFRRVLSKVVQPLVEPVMTALDAARAELAAKTTEVASLQAELAALKAQLNAAPVPAPAPAPTPAPAPAPPRPFTPVPPAQPPPVYGEAERVRNELDKDEVRNRSSTILTGQPDALRTLLTIWGNDDAQRRTALGQYVGGAQNIVFLTRPVENQPLKAIMIRAKNPTQAGNLRAGLRQELKIAGLQIRARPALSKLQLAHKRLVYALAKRQQGTDRPRIYWTGHRGAFNYEMINPSYEALATIATEITLPRAPRPPRDRRPDPRNPGPRA